MNAVVFCLWGDDPTYRIGAVKNCALIAQHYGKAWTPYFVLLPSAHDMRDALEEAGAEVTSARGELTENEGLFARFAVLGDARVKRAVFRDADSRPSAREAELVREWVRSRLPFHSIRDHRHHTAPLMGGMWGCVIEAVPVEAIDALTEWLAQVRLGADLTRGTAPGRFKRYSDQSFLQKVLWPFIESSTLVHGPDARNDLRVGREFIGQQHRHIDGVEVAVWPR